MHVSIILGNEDEIAIAHRLMLEAFEEYHLPASVVHPILSARSSSVGT
jgi:hypothetical protein